MENKFEMDIRTKLVITADDIDDIMCTALEGGSAYWLDNVYVVGEYLGKYAHEQIARGGKLRLYDMEDDEEYELTREDLLKGIKMAIEEGYYENYGWFTGQSLDTSNIDADLADVIVQLALFDYVIYS